MTLSIELPKGKIKLIRLISIPVIFDDRLVAVVSFSNKDEEYSHNDIYEITLLMNGIWNTIERREILDKLSFERNKYLQTLISISEGIVVVGSNGKIEMLNLVAERLIGCSLKKAFGKHYKEILRFNDNESYDLIEKAFKVESVQGLKMFSELLSESGDKYYLEISAAPIYDDNKILGVVLVFRDITEKREQMNKIEYLSYHDTLTGLYNRSYLEEEIIRIDKVENLPISVVMGDVNGLKLTNDIFGHVSGDELLEKAGKVFKKACRKGDVVARRGGDEFIMLLPKTTKDEAEKIIKKIKNDFSKEEIRTIKGSISMGCDTKNLPEEDLVQTLEKAEERMYDVKTVERDANKSGMVSKIIKTLHENNPREKEHSENVSAMCVALGKALDLPAEDIKRLEDAGYLHDIGKIILDPKLLSISFSRPSPRVEGD